METKDKYPAGGYLFSLSFVSGEPAAPGVLLTMALIPPAPQDWEVEVLEACLLGSGPYPIHSPGSPSNSIIGWDFTEREGKSKVAMSQLSSLPASFQTSSL